MKTVVCAGNNLQWPAFQYLVTISYNFNNRIYVVLIFPSALIIPKYIYLLLFSDDAEVTILELTPT